MTIDFAFAQARVQARHGERPSSVEWQYLESSRGLAQYLHTVRNTSLAPLVQHVTVNSSPHAIDRSLRDDWRIEVEHAASWVPPPWRGSIRWTTWLAYLPAIAYLQNGGARIPWMAADRQLAGLAVAEPAEQRRAIDAAGFEPLNNDAALADPLDAWLNHWQSLWPAAPAARPALMLLTSLLQQHRRTLANEGVSPAAASELAAQLQTRVARLMRMRMQQPAAVFCHLALTSLQMHRLRSGLIRRALFNDVNAEGVS